MARQKGRRKKTTATTKRGALLRTPEFIALVFHTE